jgi:dATP pyrophosphohydrolase
MLRLPFQVNVYCFSIVDGVVKYLLLKRTSRHNPCWQGVTGGVEQGEEFLAAATREVIEETELLPLVVLPVNFLYSYPVPVYSTHVFDRPAKTIEEHVFIAQIDSEEMAPTLSEEHDQYAWVDVDEAYEMLSWPDNKKAIRVAHKIIEKNFL